MQTQPLTQRIANEVTSYGGFPLTRADVYALALEDTGNARAADRFAWASKAIDCEPVSIDEFRAETARFREAA